VPLRVILSAASRCSIRAVRYAPIERGEGAVEAPANGCEHRLRYHASDRARIEPVERPIEVPLEDARPTYAASTPSLDDDSSRHRTRAPKDAEGPGDGAP